MADRVPLSEILPTEKPPTCGRIVLVKYLDNATDSIREIPGIVIRRGQPKAALNEVHETVNVAAFGDGPVSAPFNGLVILSGIVLLDPLGGDVPDVDMQVYGPMPGYFVWAEWMEFQAKRHAEIKAAEHKADPIPTATPVA
jgi:hypothetical protein